MKQSLTIAILCSGLIFSMQSSAELTKVRSWPPSITAPSANLVKQYEFDPAAGAGSDKLISVDTTIGTSAASSSTKVNYAKGVPVSGSGDWSNSVMAYHGFAFITASAMTTESLNYSDSGNWPSKSLKVFSVLSMKKMSNYQQKVIFECTQQRSFAASSAFPSLPGKVYEYKCVSSGSTVMTINNEKVENGIQPNTSTSYYSDYLDMILMSKSVGVDQYSSSKIEFMGVDNKPNSISFRSDQIALP
jgi:hypothetical protein